MPMAANACSTRSGTRSFRGRASRGRLLPDTVLRGGFGLYAYTWSEDTYGAGMGNAFGSSGNSTDATNGLCPVVQLSADGSTPDTTDPGCGVGQFNGQSINSLYLDSPTTPDARNGQGASYNQYHTPVPKIYQYNLQIQRQLGSNMVAQHCLCGQPRIQPEFPGGHQPGTGRQTGTER